jgi:hypothetical protein
VPGYGDVVEHTDTATPERQAVGATHTATEPAFTRVQRPNTDYAPAMNSTNDSVETEQPTRWMSSTSSGMMLPMMIGWGSLGVCAGIGVWLWLRWQRERNKPINRIRRQAYALRGQAYALRDRMPDMPEFPDEATRPAIGMGTALIGIAALVLQQWQARSRSHAEELRHRTGKMSHRAEKARSQAGKLGRKAADTIPDVDWQDRLMRLRDRWMAASSDLR